MATKKQAKRIGLGIVGAGRVGLIRGELAARHPQVDWIGIAERNPERGCFVGDTINADFVTADFGELYKRTDDPAQISPMVISGTHALDIVMWLMEAKKPVEVYARSVSKALAPKWKGIDGTGYLITFDDGPIYHGVISWALPEVWPAAV